MNPSELRMMWMSQYNPERMSLEDAATYFSHPSVMSVMDDLTHQQTMDLNPMMSIVGGDFSGQAAAAAALGVQPAALIATNTNANTIYGLAQVGGLHQQLLQQSAAAVFQNYTEIVEDDDSANASVVIGGGMLNVDGSGVDINIDNDRPSTLVTSQLLPTANDNQQQVYSQMDDATYDEGISELTPKQEYINIDDFVLMTDSNSYDETDYIPSNENKDHPTQSVLGMDNNDELLIPAANQKSLEDDNGDSGGGDGGGDITSTKNHHITESTIAITEEAASSSCNGCSSSGNRSQRKTRKIEPVNRPGLVLKTPIAYKGNIDPSVIPIQKDGMAVCERCGAIGVKHTFYTKSRRFCSMSCARGELYSLVVNNKITGGSGQNESHQHLTTGMIIDSSENTQSNVHPQEQHQHQQQQNKQSDIELELRVAHLKNSNYRFRITDQSKITQINGFGEPIISNTDLQSVDFINDSIGNNNEIIMSTTDAIDTIDNIADVDGLLSVDPSVNANICPKALRMYHDVLPQDELPQIPKLERLPGSCPQLEKIISIRRRLYDPTHSYDWTIRLSQSNFVAAPVTCFPHAPGYEVWDNIGIDMKVEVENTDCDSLEVIQPGQTPHSFWVATILNICGYKALMRYEGFNDSSHDFWVNLCNAEVHSVGWCATRGKPLIPPRTIENKYRDWKDFLVERLSGARTLPSSFYNKINDSMQSRFRLGLNLECVDKDRISQVRLATVTRIVGKRLFLRYFDSDDGFWCHEDSPIIHPVGWATTVGHNLAAPQDYLERMLAGREAMIEVHEDDATIELFKMNFTFEEYYLDGKANGFMEGMKLEAVDPLNLSSICAATVMAVLKFGYMMIRIDSYQPDASGSDWFCYHEKSPSIFPVGFCTSNNIPLTPPNGCNINTFSWETYLQETETVAAEQHLFHRVVPNHGFKVGMSLECADLMDPRLVCVATVARVVGRLLKIHFDGWTDEYDQWLDCESPDVYPVGWCVLVNHKLEGPPAIVQPANKTVPKVKTQKKRKKKNISKSNNNECTVKSRTIALKTNPHLPKLSIKLELKPEHHNAAFYEDNAGGTVEHEIEGSAVMDEDEEDEYEEDSTSHRSDQSTPLSTADITASAGNTNAALTQSIPTSSAMSGIENQGRSNSSTVKKPISPAPPSAGRRAPSYIANSSVSNSKYIPRLNDSNDHNSNTEVDLIPETWNVYDVSQFLRVNDCTAHCDNFSRNKIDGKRMLQLSKDEIITLLGMKVGPALKIYDLIQQLKCRVNPGKSRLHQKSTKAFL